MLDSEIVAAVVAGDADGLAAAYDRYAAPLHEFCCSLLTGPADAADAVLDTFLIARAGLGGLRDPDLLRSWLYAVARNECHRRLRERAAAAGPDAAAGMSHRAIDLGDDLERAAPPQVADAAIASLGPGQREVAELSLRHDFDSEDLASTLGIPLNRAQVLASRTRGQFEKTLGLLLVARSGRLSCRKLDEILEESGGQLTGPVRDRLNRHIRRCRACSGRKRRELEPALLLLPGVLPVTAVARGLRPQVLGLATSGAADAVAYRDAVGQRAGPFQESGFPVPLDQPRAARTPRPSVLAVAAAAVFALLCALALQFGVNHGHGRPLAAAAPAGGRLLASPPVPAAASSRARAKHTSSRAGTVSSVPARPGVTPSADPAGPAPLPVLPRSTPAAGSSPSARPPGTPGPSPSSTPSPAPTQTAGTLSVAPTSVTLGVSAGGGASSGSFTLTADGGAVSYAISVPPAYAGELIVSPASGSLASGASVTVSVTWNSSAVLDTGLTVGPDGQTVTVSYQPPTGSPTTAAAAADTGTGR